MAGFYCCQATPEISFKKDLNIYTHNILVSRFPYRTSSFTTMEQITHSTTIVSLHWESPYHVSLRSCDNHEIVLYYHRSSILVGQHICIETAPIPIQYIYSYAYSILVLFCHANHKLVFNWCNVLCQFFSVACHRVNPMGQSFIIHIFHFGDVIMGAMASQITSLTIVYSTVYSGAGQRNRSKFHVTGLCVGNSPVTGEFPAQMASNAENVSIWWRHHAQK